MRGRGLVPFQDCPGPSFGPVCWLRCRCPFSSINKYIIIMLHRQARAAGWLQGPFLPWQTGTFFLVPQAGVYNNIPDECRLCKNSGRTLSTYGRLPCRVHHGPFPAARVQAAGERGRTWILPRLLARRTRLRPPPQPHPRRRATRRRARSVRALTLLSRSRASRPKHGAAARDSHTRRDSPSHTPSFAAQGSAPLRTSGWA